MNKTAWIIGVIVLIVAVFFGIKYFGMSPMSSKSTGNVTAPANGVIIQGNAFNPDSLTVKVGTSVTWTNNDSYDHTVTSDSGAFDSGHIAAGQSYSFTFSKVGTYTYHCSVHPFMTAKIVVTN